MSDITIPSPDQISTFQVAAAALIGAVAGTPLFRMVKQLAERKLRQAEKEEFQQKVHDAIGGTCNEKHKEILNEVKASELRIMAEVSKHSPNGKVDKIIAMLEEMKHDSSAREQIFREL